MVKNEKIYDAPRFNNVREIFENTVKLFPNNNAFILKEKQEKKIEYKNITYTEFKKDVDYLGTALMNLGLKDKRVAIIAPNMYEWCTSYLAVLNGVGTLVPLDKGLPDDEIESLLKRSYSDAVIFDKKYINIMNKIKQNNDNKIKHYICIDELEDERTINSDFIKYNDLLEKGKKLVQEKDKSFIDAKINKYDMKILLFTSGTTSNSKAVMLSHQNIAENIYALNCVEKIYDNDISLSLLPMHHTFGSTGFLFFLSNGAATAFCDGLRYIAQNLKEYKISIFVCVPLLLEAMYKKVNIEIKKQGKTKVIKIARKISNFLLKIGIDIRKKVFKQIIDNMGGHLRFVVSGAAPIDKEVAKGFNDYGVRTIQGYGLTETSPVLTAENDKYIRYGSVGLPMINVDIKIDNPNEQGIGEIIAKGPNVMLGYYENEEATKEVIKDGWFHTGDLGYIDKDGFVFITGRKKNVIVLKNGKNIYPEESETLINNLEYVAESMVFGYPKEDDLLLSAKIVYNKEYIENTYPNISKEDLEKKIWNDIKNINSNMATYKHIKKIIITDKEMIKTTTQKVKRFEEIDNIIKENRK